MNLYHRFNYGLLQPSSPIAYYSPIDSGPDYPIIVRNDVRLTHFHGRHFGIHLTSDLSKNANIEIGNWEHWKEQIAAGAQFEFIQTITEKDAKPINQVGIKQWPAL